MRSTSSAAVVLFGLFLLGGCEDRGSGVLADGGAVPRGGTSGTPPGTAGAPGSQPGSPAAKCETLVRTLCERIVFCRADGVTEDSCVSQGIAQLNCSGVSEVTSTFDACLAEIRAATCPLPMRFPNCVGVLR